MSNDTQTGIAILLLVGAVALLLVEMVLLYRRRYCTHPPRFWFGEAALALAACGWAVLLSV